MPGMSTLRLDKAGVRRENLLPRDMRSRLQLREGRPRAAPSSRRGAHSAAPQGRHRYTLCRHTSFCRSPALPGAPPQGSTEPLTPACAASPTPGVVHGSAVRPSEWETGQSRCGPWAGVCGRFSARFLSDLQMTALTACFPISESLSSLPCAALGHSAVSDSV